MFNQSRNSNGRNNNIVLIVIALIIIVAGLVMVLNKPQKQNETASKSGEGLGLSASSIASSQLDFAEETKKTSYTSIAGKTNSNTNTSSNNGTISGSQPSFTNKYGTATTKCAHSGCNNYIASSGDTNCCAVHSKKCAECGKYIDEDALYCMDCITKATTGSKTNSSTNNSSSTGSFSNQYGTATTKCAHPGCNNPIASTGDTNCCTIHSKRCLECGKYIDEDAMYCMSCISKSLYPSGSSGGYSSGYSSNDSAGSSSSGSYVFSGYSDSMSDAEFDSWLDSVFGDY